MKDRGKGNEYSEGLISKDPVLDQQNNMFD